MNTEELLKSEYERSTLPEFKCHKRVKAAKIAEMQALPTMHVNLHLEGMLDPVTVPPDWFKKFNPKVGHYYVLYNDDYESASPAKAFEEGYLKVEPMGCSEANAPTTQAQTEDSFSFGVAILNLKKGLRVARAGWNGKGMWLMLVRAELAEAVSFQFAALKPSPWIGMKTADECFVPWLASQTDMLAEDWVLV